MQDKLKKIHGDVIDVIIQLSGKSAEVSIALHKISREINQLIKDNENVSKTSKS